jgi:hypothetical protein
MRNPDSESSQPLNVRSSSLSLIYLPALATLWAREAAKLGGFVVYAVGGCARLLPALGAGAGIMRSGLPDLGSPSATDHDVEWSAGRRPFYTVDGEPEDGDDASASGDNVGVCGPRHGPTAMLVVGAFFLLHVQ